MSTCFVSNICFLFLFLYVVASDTRRFWQVTDFHHDPNYTTVGDPGNVDNRRMCHRTADYTSNSSAGRFGNYLCDAPWSLVEAAVEGMKEIEPNPDFILWTGDDPPHVPVPTLSSPKVLDIIRNITDLIRRHFPDTRVFPVLGNHDYYPKGQMPPDNQNDPIYETIANMWVGDQWIGSSETESFDTFRRGGFYESTYEPPNGGQTLRMVGLNTVYYYHQDLLTKDVEDPASQLEWLTSVFGDAQEKGQKVYLFGHVPPGMFERKRNTNWFYPDFNVVLTQFIIDSSDVIAGQFFAHQHSDSFKLFYGVNDDGKGSGVIGVPAGVMYLAPSVTPWKTTLDGVSANNPSIRLYEYDATTGAVVNIQQYYMNLTEANVNGTARWELEYSATAAYGLHNVNSSSIGSLVESFLTNQSLFNMYYEYNSVSYADEPCDDDCKTTQICSIMCPLYDQYASCLNDPQNARQLCSLRVTQSGPSDFPVYADVLIGVGAGLIICVFVFVLLWKEGRQRRKMIFRVDSKEPLLSPTDPD